MHYLVTLLLYAAPGPLALLPVDKADLKAAEEGADHFGDAADRVTVWPPAKGTSATLLVFVWNADQSTRQFLFELSALYAEQRANGVRMFAVDNTPSLEDPRLLPLSFPLLLDDAGVDEHFGIKLEVVPSVALLGPKGEVKAVVKIGDRAGLEALIAQLPKPKRVAEKERVGCAERIVKRAQKGELSALALRQAWITEMRGGMPEGEKLSEAELTRAKKLGASLKPRTVVEAPTRVEPGDLLVSRIPWEKAGAIRAVRSFDAATWTAKVLTWDEEKKTLEEGDFQLSTDPPGAPERLLRPGLFQLRPSDLAACPR